MKTDKMLRPLVDYEHPRVQALAAVLGDGRTGVVEQVEQIFYFVRDEIQFHFPLNGDFVSASKTIATKRGQCNTKGTLFLALCRSLEIPARLHFSYITKEIQRGFYVGWAYWLLPQNLSHSWIEVKLDGVWHSIDGYINDLPLHTAALKELDRRGWQTGFSISKPTSPSSDFQLGAEKFEQMAAVTDDHGVWNEPADYYCTDRYANRPPVHLMGVYRTMVRKANRRVAKLRATAKALHAVR